MSRSMKEKASLNKIPTVLLFFWKQHLVIMTKKKTNRRKVMLLWLKFKSIKLVLILFFFPSSLLSSQGANHKWIITDQFLASNDDKKFVVNGIVGHLAFRSVLEWRRTTFFLVEICKDQSFFSKRRTRTWQAWIWKECHTERHLTKKYTLKCCEFRPVLDFILSIDSIEPYRLKKDTSLDR